MDFAKLTRKLEGLGETARYEANHKSLTGEPCEMKVSRTVWRGGKGTLVYIRITCPTLRLCWKYGTTEHLQPSSQFYARWWRDYIQSPQRVTGILSL